MTTAAPTRKYDGPALEKEQKPLPIHKLCKLTPAMSKEQFDILVESIKHEGLLDDIEMYRGKVIDGRHRMFALIRLGWPLGPYTKEVDVKGSVEGYILAKRRARAHHSKSEIACFTAILISETPERQRKNRIPYLLSESGVGQSMIRKALVILKRSGRDVVEKIIKGELALSAEYEKVKDVREESEEPVTAPATSFHVPDEQTENFEPEVESSDSEEDGAPVTPPNAERDKEITLTKKAIEESIRRITHVNSIIHGKKACREYKKITQHLNAAHSSLMDWSATLED